MNFGGITGLQRLLSAPLQSIQMLMSSRWASNADLFHSSRKSREVQRLRVEDSDFLAICPLSLGQRSWKGRFGGPSPSPPLLLFLILLWIFFICLCADFSWSPMLFCHSILLPDWFVVYSIWEKVVPSFSTCIIFTLLVFSLIFPFYLISFITVHRTCVKVSVTSSVLFKGLCISTL